MQIDIRESKEITKIRFGDSYNAYIEKEDFGIIKIGDVIIFADEVDSLINALGKAKELGWLKE